MKSKRNKYKVNRKTLLFTAGFIWLVAGINVLNIGIQTWQAVEHITFKTKAIYASIVLIIFLFAIFKPLHKKYVSRIISLTDQNHPLAFFDTKGWSIMAFMITLGVSVRYFNLLPEIFIATFYTGLSIALSSTGVLFIYSWLRFKPNT